MLSFEALKSSVTSLSPLLILILLAASSFWLYGLVNFVLTGMLALCDQNRTTSLIPSILFISSGYLLNRTLREMAFQGSVAGSSVNGYTEKEPKDARLHRISKFQTFYLIRYLYPDMRLKFMLSICRRCPTSRWIVQATLRETPGHISISTWWIPTCTTDQARWLPAPTIFNVLEWLYQSIMKIWYVVHSPHQ